MNSIVPVEKVIYANLGKYNDPVAIVFLKKFKENVDFAEFLKEASKGSLLNTAEYKNFKKSDNFDAFSPYGFYTVNNFKKAYNIR